MTDREWVLLCWRLMIQFVRAYGQRNGLCADIQIVKQPKVTDEQIQYLNESM